MNKHTHIYGLKSGKTYASFVEAAKSGECIVFDEVGINFKRDPEKEKNQMHNLMRLVRSRQTRELK